jgi:cytochrome c-type biogenesis protein CcmH
LWSPSIIRDVNSTSLLFWVVVLVLTGAALAFVLAGLLRGGATRRGAAIWVIAAVVPLAAGALYMVFGTPQAVNGSSELGPDLAPTTAADYISRLDAHLKRQPRDARGWVLLARAHAEADRFDAAARAYEQALAVSPDKVAKDPSVLCEYADVLAMQQGRSFSGKPLQLVNRALELNARHPMALEMAGSAAYDEGRYGEAARYWSELLPQLRAGTRRHTELTAAIEQARQKAESSPQR